MTEKLLKWISHVQKKEGIFPFAWSGIRKTNGHIIKSYVFTWNDYSLNLPSNVLSHSTLYVHLFQCFTSRFLLALQCRTAFLNPTPIRFLPVCLFPILMAVLLLLLYCECWEAGSTEKAAAEAAAGLSVQHVEWHLHFKRSRWNKPRHFYNIWYLSLWLVPPHPLSPSPLCALVFFSLPLSFSTLNHLTLMLKKKHTKLWHSQIDFLIYCGQISWYIDISIISWYPVLTASLALLESNEIRGNNCMSHTQPPHKTINNRLHVVFLYRLNKGDIKCWTVSINHGGRRLLLHLHRARLAVKAIEF